MHWLEKHMDSFFKLNGILWLIAIPVSIWSLYSTMGLPNNSIDTWETYQWVMVKAYWVPKLMYCIIYLLFSMLCFARKYPVFPIMTLFLASSLNIILFNINQVLEKGLIYPGPNLAGILGIIQFVLGLIGTMLWIKKRFLSS